MTLAILTVIIKRFKNEEEPLNIAGISTRFAIPPRLTAIVVNFLIDCNLISRLGPKNGEDPIADAPLVPSTSPEHYSLGHVMNA
ncbi:MAG: hypothetical protein K2I02_08210, partial [Duncaniella sp.]|nr:hypothetical protein [Duncaniella sp.]